MRKVIWIADKLVNPAIRFGVTFVLALVILFIAAKLGQGWAIGLAVIINMAWHIPVIVYEVEKERRN